MTVNDHQRCASELRRVVLRLSPAGAPARTCLTDALRSHFLAAVSTAAASPGVETIASASVAAAIAPPSRSMLWAFVSNRESRKSSAGTAASSTGEMGQARVGLMWPVMASLWLVQVESSVVHGERPGSPAQTDFGEFPPTSLLTPAGVVTSRPSPRLRRTRGVRPLGWAYKSQKERATVSQCVAGLPPKAQR